MNPFGVPPPGMPYMERRESVSTILTILCSRGGLWTSALRPDEVDSQAEDDSDEDEGKIQRWRELSEMQVSTS
jgi:hypothetical protein